MASNESKRGRRKKQSPTVPAGRPKCPTWLSTIGKKYWIETVDLMESVPGLLSTIDNHSLAAYCEAWEEFHAARQEIDDVGATAISEKGLPYQHPAVGRKNKALERIRFYQKQFGFTPDARYRMKMEAENDTAENPFERFLNNRFGKSEDN